MEKVKMLKNNRYGFIPLTCQIFNDLIELAEEFKEAKLSWYSGYDSYYGYVDSNTPRLEFINEKFSPSLYVGTYLFETDKPFHISIYRNNPAKDTTISLSIQEYSKDKLRNIIMTECLGQKYVQLTLF